MKLEWRFTDNTDDHWIVAEDHETNRWTRAAEEMFKGEWKNDKNAVLRIQYEGHPWGSLFRLAKEQPKPKKPRDLIGEASVKALSDAGYEIKRKEG